MECAGSEFQGAGMAQSAAKISPRPGLTFHSWQESELTTTDHRDLRQAGLWPSPRALLPSDTAAPQLPVPSTGLAPLAQRLP